MNININLTEKQECFLKKFANDNFDGSKKNLCTYKPIHFVETQDYSLQCDNCSSNCEDRIIYVNFESYYESIQDLLETEFQDYLSKNDLYDIKKLNNDIDNYELDDIIERYQRKFNYKFDYEIRYKVYYYRYVACFLIREEAERYIEYQKHNLTNPRVYTYSPGYSNFGDFEHFFDLLMNIGKQLNNSHRYNPLQQFYRSSLQY